MGEKIVIGTGPDAITLVVLRVRRWQVRIGIDAPKRVPISHPETERYGVPQADRVH